MAQIQLNWDNSELLASANALTQTMSYRQKTVGGAWLTTGFTPANPMAKTVNAALSTNTLLANVVYEFYLLTNCTENGPTPNDNGQIEQLGFACIIPTVNKDQTTSTANINLAGTDITKVRFILRRTSDNAIVYGPVTVNRAGNSAQTLATGLVGNTQYYWQVALFTTVSGVEVVSSSVVYIGDVCGPYPFTTDDLPVQDLIWIPLDSSCETEGGLTIIKSITGLSSPLNTWYDEPNNRVYVADQDSTDGNVYWFNPDTATTAADMTHSTTIDDQNLYNNFIDPIYKKIYFVGANTGGLLVYDIATDTTSVVAFGTNGAFSRIPLYVSPTKIYCGDDIDGIVVIIDRATLTIDSTILASSIPNPDHFDGSPYTLQEANGKMYVASSNGFLGTVGVYDPLLTTNIGEITLPGATTWDFGGYWQSIFSDPVSGNLYVGDFGSSRRYIIDPLTDTVIDNKVQLNRSGKGNAVHSWELDPITNNLYCFLSCQDNSTDSTPVVRTYIEDRTSHLYLNMFENQFFEGLSHITGSSRVVGARPGNTSWSGVAGWDTDGSITILSQSAGSDNTGIEIVNTLQEVDHNNGDLPTGNTKPNIIGDPDYIPPTENLTACPLAATLTCPTDLVTTFTSGTLYYEFALLSSVIKNPAIAKIEVYAYNTGTASVEGSPVVYTGPFPDNFFDGSFAALAGSNYTIQVRFLDGADIVLQTC